MTCDRHVPGMSQFRRFGPTSTECRRAVPYVRTADARLGAGLIVVYGASTSNTFSATASLKNRIGHRFRGHQRLSVWMARAPIDIVSRPLFYQAAAVHHSNPVTQMMDQAEVVSDHQITHPVAFLKIEEEVDDLRLNGQVKGSCRLVEHDQ